MRVLLLAAFLLPGCAFLRAALGGFERPEIRFEKVELSGWSATGVELATAWRVDNPNEVPLDVTSLSYQLEVEGKRIATGKPPLGIRIPASSSARIVLPATVRFADVLPAAEAILGKRKLRWKASGEAGVDTPAGVLTYPLSASGTVDVPPPEKLLRHLGTRGGAAGSDRW